MRIAVICETFLPAVNGVTTTLCRLLDHLQEQGHEALLFAPHGSPSTYAGTRVVPLESVPLPFYPEVKFTPPQFGITAELTRFKPDLIHLVGPVVLGASVPAIAQSLRLPLVSSYHTNFGTYSSYYGWGMFRKTINAYLRWVHNRCRITLCPSRATRRELHIQGYRRLRVWGRGVDTVRFNPDFRSDAWRESVGAQPGEKVLIYTGRLAREKRIEMLLPALQGLEGARLVVVGDGPERAKLEAAGRDLPIHFTGYLRGEELSTAYASADAFVFPSDTETFGQVMQEAMASGLPVVAAAAGGALDLVQPGVNGLLFTPGSSADLHMQLRRLVTDGDTCSAMGIAGRRAAEAHAWPVIMNELMGHYRRVLRTPIVPRLTRRAA